MIFKQYFSVLIIFAAALFYSCGSDDPITPANEDPQNSYIKVLTAENGTLKFELWSATSNPMRFGYNKIGIKVFESSSPKTTGFVKFFPWFYWSSSQENRSTPVSPQFDYVDSLEMFTGYAMFKTISGGGVQWNGRFNYNDQLFMDSVSFSVNSFSSAQIIYISDPQSSYIYYFSLVKPYSPVQGQNTYQCMLHRTLDELSFEQVNDAQIYIMPWMETMGHGSPNNVHPSYTSEGIYQGEVNFNMAGQWVVYDTIYHANHKLTGNIPPKFTFDIQ